MPNERTEPIAPDSSAPTGALIREALDEARTLAKLELALVRDELKGDLARVKVSGALFGAAAAAALSGFTMLLVALATAWSTAWLAALVTGLVLLALATVLGLVGWRSVPKKPLGETAQRLESDVRQLKERVV